IPALSSSVDSNASSASSQSLEIATAVNKTADLIPARPELRRQDSEESHNKGREKHITPTHLEKIVVLIKENKKITPLHSNINPPPSTEKPSTTTTTTKTNSPQQKRREDTTPHPSSPPLTTI